MFGNLEEAFGSRIKALELLYVVEGIKPCARILVNEKIKDNAEKVIGKAGINYQISDFKLLKENNSKSYSDRSVSIPAGDKREGHFIFYLSKNNQCKDAKNLESEEDHFNLGLILGYPKCCCRFFQDKFSKDNADLTLDCLDNSSGFEFPFQLNICARHFDIGLLSHFPCSFSCKESIQIAKANMEVVEKHSKQMLDSFENMLKSVSIYAEGDGIFILTMPRKIGQQQIHYSNVYGTSHSKLFYFLKSNDRMAIMDKHHFVISGEKINRPVMAFS